MKTINYQTKKKQIRSIRKHGQKNLFNFYNNLIDDEIDSGKFINIAENNITLCENEPIFNVETNAGKNNYPFILEGYTTINYAEPVEINRFFKDIDQLTKSIEKMVDNYDETLEILYSGEMIKYTRVSIK